MGLPAGHRRPSQYELVGERGAGQPLHLHQRVQGMKYSSHVLVCDMKYKRL